MLEKDSEIEQLEKQLNDLYLQLCGIPPNCMYNEVQMVDGTYHFYDLTDYDNNGVTDYTTYLSDDVQACFNDNWASYESTGVHIEGSGKNGAISSSTSTTEVVYTYEDEIVGDNSATWAPTTGGASDSQFSTTTVIETGSSESPDVNIDDFDMSAYESEGSSSSSFSFSSSSTMEPEVVTTTSTDMYYDDYYDFYEDDASYYEGSDDFNYYYSM